MKNLTLIECMIIIGMVLILALLFTGCTDAEREAYTSYNHPFRVTMWGQNGPVKEWISTGRVISEENSDGWYFKDSATNNFVRVSGNVSVEELSTVPSASPSP